MRLRTGRLQKRACAAALALLGALAATPAAQAGGFASADECPVVALEQPFLPWLDSDLYALVSGGDFESDAAGWSLDGARVVDGNEPFYVGGADDRHALSIPSAAAATSDTVCVGVEERTLRLFVRSGDASPASRLRVEVLYEDTQGAVRSQPLDLIAADAATSWTPHVPMAIGISSHPRIDGKTPVRFRFTPQGPADWQIDDVYVDPRYH